MSSSDHRHCARLARTPFVSGTSLGKHIETKMAPGFWPISRVADKIRRTVNFTLCDGATEICCTITFEALQRLARVSGNVAEIAEQLFDRHRHDIEAIALGRYAAGDFAHGVVHLDADDFPRPVNTP